MDIIYTRLGGDWAGQGRGYYVSHNFWHAYTRFFLDKILFTCTTHRVHKYMLHCKHNHPASKVRLNPSLTMFKNSILLFLFPPRKEMSKVAYLAGALLLAKQCKRSNRIQILFYWKSRTDLIILSKTGIINLYKKCRKSYMYIHWLP